MTIALDPVRYHLSKGGIENGSGSEMVDSVSGVQESNLLKKLLFIWRSPDYPKSPLLSVFVRSKFYLRFTTITCAVLAKAAGPASAISFVPNEIWVPSPDSSMPEVHGQNYRPAWSLTNTSQKFAVVILSMHALLALAHIIILITLIEGHIRRLGDRPYRLNQARTKRGFNIQNLLHKDIALQGLLCLPQTADKQEGACSVLETSSNPNSAVEVRENIGRFHKTKGRIQVWFPTSRGLRLGEYEKRADGKFTVLQKRSVEIGEDNGSSAGAASPPLEIDTVYAVQPLDDEIDPTRRHPTSFSRDKALLPESNLQERAY
ncbi:Nn.00g079240.m01.CDS01 [Neocucurbitaria sp. VM-36]